jgi:hypothetical protein
MEKIVQKIERSYSEQDIAYIYYSVISIVNKLGITDMELNLLAYTAIRGGITNPAAKKDFCETYKTSLAYINNMISKLRKKKLLIKRGSKIAITPVIALNFKNDVTLQIALKNQDVTR